MVGRRMLVEAAIAEVSGSWPVAIGNEEWFVDGLRPWVG